MSLFSTLNMCAVPEEFLHGIKCAKCGKCLSAEPIFAITESNDYQCARCNKTKSKNRIKRYMRVNTHNEFPTQAPECLNTGPGCPYYEVMKRIKTPKLCCQYLRAFKCFHCENYLLTPEGLVLHTKSEHPRFFVNAGEKIEFATDRTEDYVVCVDDGTVLYMEKVNVGPNKFNLGFKILKSNNCGDKFFPKLIVKPSVEDAESKRTMELGLDSRIKLFDDKEIDQKDMLTINLDSVKEFMRNCSVAFHVQGN